MGLVFSRLPGSHQESEPSKSNQESEPSESNQESEPSESNQESEPSESNQETQSPPSKEQIAQQEIRNIIESELCLLQQALDEAFNGGRGVRNDEADQLLQVYDEMKRCQEVVTQLLDERTFLICSICLTFPERHQQLWNYSCCDILICNLCKENSVFCSNCQESFNDRPGLPNFRRNFYAEKLICFRSSVDNGEETSLICLKDLLEEKKCETSTSLLTISSLLEEAGQENVELVLEHIEQSERYEDCLEIVHEMEISLGTNNTEVDLVHCCICHGNADPDIILYGCGHCSALLCSNCRECYIVQQRGQRRHECPVCRGSLGSSAELPYLKRNIWAEKMASMVQNSSEINN